MREDEGQDAAAAAMELVRLVLRGGSQGRSEPTIWYAEVHAAVAADGWEYDRNNERLLSTVPGVSVADETTFVEDTLTGRGWPVAAEHYRQALDAFGTRNWESANAQLRSTLEDLLRSTVELFSGDRPDDAQACLDVLRKHKVLLDGEFGFAKGLWALCQPRFARGAER
jgi:hypothetical protein